MLSRIFTNWVSSGVSPIRSSREAGEIETLDEGEYFLYDFVSDNQLALYSEHRKVVFFVDLVDKDEQGRHLDQCRFVKSKTPQIELRAELGSHSWMDYNSKTICSLLLVPKKEEEEKGPEIERMMFYKFGFGHVPGPSDHCLSDELISDSIPKHHFVMYNTDDCKLNVWDYEKSEMRMYLKNVPTRVDLLHLGLSSDAQTAVAVYKRGGICTWDVKTGDLISRVHTDKVLEDSVFVSDDCNTILSGDMIWYRQSDVWTRLKHTSNQPERHSKFVGLSPDGKLAVKSVVYAGGHRTSVLLIDTKTKETVKEIGIERLSLFSHCEFSPDGSKLLCKTYKAPIVLSIK